MEKKADSATMFLQKRGEQRAARTGFVVSRQRGKITWYRVADMGLEENREGKKRRRDRTLLGRGFCGSSYLEPKRGVEEKGGEGPPTTPEGVDFPASRKRQCAPSQLSSPMKGMKPTRVNPIQKKGKKVSLRGQPSGAIERLPAE